MLLFSVQLGKVRIWCYNVLVERIQIIWFWKDISILGQSEIPCCEAEKEPQSLLPSKTLDHMRIDFGLSTLFEKSQGSYVL